MRLLLTKGNEVLVWCKEDIKLLRNQYHITGKLVGCHPRAPRQNSILVAPMYLTKDEVTLLLEKGFAALWKEKDDDLDIDLHSRRTVMDEHFKVSLHEQQKLAYDQKKSDIQSKSDQIARGIAKKKRLPEPMTDELRESIVDQVISDIKPIEEQHMLVQQPLEDLWPPSVVEASWNYPQTDAERARYLVFKDLWQQQYFLSGAAKFGGDFLVYPGDPNLFHATYIATCHMTEETLTPQDTVQMARLSSNVKKTALICSVNLDTSSVSYTRLNYNPE